MTASQNNALFNSDLQTFIVTKYDPLLTIVKELNDKLQNSEKDRFRLERRIIRLEKQMLLLLEKLEVSDIIDNELREKKEEKKIHQTIEHDDNLLAPWLFSCQLGTPLSSLQVLLEFSVKDTMELNVKLWKREEDMWINFLEDLPSNSKNFLPDTLKLIDLRRAARKCLLNLCTNEILIVLRNVPGKSQAVYNTTTMTLVAILASAFYEAWKRIELTDPVSLGRIVLVLDGENVGSRLRAGNKKLKIEPLN
ncbi:conserved Plasmodium protein, unknown function [Plasmodium gallinaceum]|uniref:Apicomplexan specific coiled coil protein n=1 Tax=Plasmodium gallinaceum TaxID=5849 RepID=A0A1J1H347_PLAGA|nr:conserved Plasmodium protein, unknown function [Plasmodium gallinaceum]CRG97909.1 conserved Plasmodium protein, unknown function [Plasmodium gallinaceum]